MGELTCGPPASPALEEFLPQTIIFSGNCFYVPCFSLSKSTTTLSWPALWLRGAKLPPFVNPQSRECSVRSEVIRYTRLYVPQHSGFWLMNLLAEYSFPLADSMFYLSLNLPLLTPSFGYVVDNYLLAQAYSEGRNLERVCFLSHTFPSCFLGQVLFWGLSD